VLAVEDSARRAVESVRAGHGPHFLECRTYRFRAHSMYDPELYRERSEVEEWKRRDPLTLLATRLREAGALDDTEEARLEQEVAAEIDDAVAVAEAGQLEAVDELTRFVYSEVAS